MVVLVVDLCQSPKEGHPVRSRWAATLDFTLQMKGSQGGYIEQGSADGKVAPEMLCLCGATG